MGNECVGKAKSFSEMVRESATEKLWEAYERYQNYGGHSGYKQARTSEKDFENGSLLKNDSDEEALDFDEDKNETELLDNEKLSRIEIDKKKRPEKKRKQPALKEQLLDLEDPEPLQERAQWKQESNRTQLLDMQVDKPQSQEQPVSELVEELAYAVKGTDEGEEWSQQWDQQQYYHQNSKEEASTEEPRQRQETHEQYLMQELTDAIDDDDEEEFL